MAYTAEQTEHIESCIFHNPDKPWKIRSRSGYRGYIKKALHRRERQRLRDNIECPPEYKKYDGWEY